MIGRIVALLALLAFTTMAAAQDKTEPLRLHPDNPHYLLFRGKPAVLITSGEHYGSVLNLDINYVPYLDEVQSKNLNLTRTFSGTYREVHGSFGITDNTLAPRNYCSPWARSNTPGAADGGNKFDLSQWNDAYFARLKDFVSQASKRGIVVEYVLFCPFYEEDLWKINPMNPANNVNGVGNCPRTEVYTLKHQDLLAVHDAFVRKAVAELNGFDNVYFEICNEPYFGGVMEDWQAHISQTVVETEKNLPNKHLIAQNIANAGKKVEKPNPLVSIFNYHYATPPDTVAENYGLNKVISDDETGFRGKDDVYYRTEGWEFILAGGAIYSNLDYSFTPGHPRGDLRDYKSPGGGSPELRRSLGALRDFMNSFDFVRMSPKNSLIKGGTVTAPFQGAPAQASVTARCLAEEGKAYAIYVRGGTQANLLVEMPAGSYKAEWIDPKTGKVESSDEFQHTGGERKLASPSYSEDMALRIKRIG